MNCINKWSLYGWRLTFGASRIFWQLLWPLYIHIFKHQTNRYTAKLNETYLYHPVQSQTHSPNFRRSCSSYRLALSAAASCASSFCFGTTFSLAFHLNSVRLPVLLVRVLTGIFEQRNAFPVLRSKFIADTKSTVSSIHLSDFVHTNHHHRTKMITELYRVIALK